MDEIIDKLRASNQPVPVPLELPDEDDLVDVQEALFISLDSDFHEFLLTVSDVVFGSLESVTASDLSSHTCLQTEDPEQVQNCFTGHPAVRCDIAAAPRIYT